MQQGIEEARMFAERSAGLRDAIGASPREQLDVLPLAQGEHNSNFRVACRESGRVVVLRLNYASQLGLADQATYEFHALQTLAASNRVPRPLFLDDTKQIVGRGVLAMEFCEGAPLDYRRAEDVVAAAEALADIHSVAIPERSRLLRPDDPLREQFAECVRLFESYRRWSDAEERVVGVVDRLLARAQDALDAAPPATDNMHALNTEAIAAHFLIPRNGEPARMVDWEKPIVGEAAQDVAYFLSPTTTIWDVDYVFDDDERERFVEAYWRAVAGRFPRSGFDERFGAYVMTNCLRGITWSAAAIVEYRDPSRALRNEKTAARLGLYLAPEFLAMIERRFFAER